MSHNGSLGSDRGAFFVLWYIYTRVSLPNTKYSTSRNSLRIFLAGRTASGITFLLWEGKLFSRSFPAIPRLSCFISVRIGDSRSVGETETRSRYLTMTSSMPLDPSTSPVICRPSSRPWGRLSSQLLIKKISHQFIFLFVFVGHKDPFSVGFFGPFSVGFFGPYSVGHLDPYFVDFFGQNSVGFFGLFIINTPAKFTGPLGLSLIMFYDNQYLMDTICFPPFFADLNTTILDLRYIWYYTYFLTLSHTACITTLFSLCTNPVFFFLFSSFRPLSSEITLWTSSYQDSYTRFSGLNAKFGTPFPSEIH